MEPRLPSPLRLYNIGSNRSTEVDIEQVRSILPTLIDSLTDAVVVLDRQQRIVAANRRYLQVFGRGRASVLGSVCHDALHCPEDTHGEGGCVACQVMDQKLPATLVRNLTDSTGASRRWEATFTPVVADAGEVTHVVEVWRDITERSQLEMQISHSERLASLGILAAGVGHEINNPLASVLAGVESLTRWLSRRDFGLDAQQEARELLDIVEREVLRCRDTTHKLMLLARPISSTATRVDLNTVVRDTLALLRFQTTRQGITVEERLDPDLPSLWARDSGLRSLCMNLMMNAVQAMPTGGTLTVATANGRPGIILTIEDTGPGIAPEHLDRIWDPFFTTKPAGTGTGLGLTITHRIATRHGGRVRAESGPGRGARFVVELPISRPGGSDV